MPRRKPNPEPKQVTVTESWFFEEASSEGAGNKPRWMAIGPRGQLIFTLVLTVLFSLLAYNYAFFPAPNLLPKLAAAGSEVAGDSFALSRWTPGGRIVLAFDRSQTVLELERWIVPGVGMPRLLQQVRLLGQPTGSYRVFFGLGVLGAVISGLTAARIALRYRRRPPRLRRDRLPEPFRLR